MKARQAKALVGSEVRREREAAAQRRAPLVKHTTKAKVSQYDPDA